MVKSILECGSMKQLAMDGLGNAKRPGVEMEGHNREGKDGQPQDTI